jgi:hypothetical protein
MALSPQTGSIKNTSDTIPLLLSKDQEQLVVTNARIWQESLFNQYSLRSEFEEIDRLYMREKDWTEDQIKSRLANRRGDSAPIQNVTVPIIMPQVNSCAGYLSEVFLSGYPMFPVVADPANEDSAAQIETIIQENAIRGAWARQLRMFFIDGLKYNIHAIECEWQQKTNWMAENSPASPGGVAAKKVLWEGNVVKRLDMYNTFWDTSVAPADIAAEGDFAGYTEIYSKIRFKKFCNDLYNKLPKNNIITALESQSMHGAVGNTANSPYSFYIPQINPFPSFKKSSGADWHAYMTGHTVTNSNVKYANAYAVTKVYARILPSDYGFAVPEKNTPQVWKFIIINGKVVLSAERLTNIHNFLPIFFGQPIEDGLEYQTKSFANNVSDMQSVASSLWNGAIASKRRLVTDRVLYDPSRINAKDINSTNPAAKIPVRQSAYGKPLGDAVYQFPFRDDQVESLVQGSGMVVNMANLINGQNPAQQGQFVKGNKTRHEYDDVMGHGNAQNKAIAMTIENQVFLPMKEVLKLNILQFQQETVLFNRDKGETVNVKPTDLRKTAVHFKVADGLVPSDKITGDDLLQVVIQQFGTSPQLASGYNLAQAFTYLMKTQGLDLTPFAKTQEQMMYEQAMAAWQQAAMEASKHGTNFNSPQPQPSPALQQEMQQKQQNGGYNPSSLSAALESTQS